MMSKERRPGTKKSGTWIDITRDDFHVYDGLWKFADGEEDKKKRACLDQLNGWKEKESYFQDTVLANGNDVLVMSIWDQ